MTQPFARLSGALLLALLLAVPARAAGEVPVSVVDGAVVWAPSGEYSQAALTLTSPSGLEYRRSFPVGEDVRLHPGEIGDVPLPDGFYSYNLLITGPVQPGATEAPATRQTGTLEVRGGVAIDSPVLDQVIQDDLIVTFSLCVGNDCVNGESFGFDTIRLKENNLRIKFQDTSNSASFPSNDWQITINDSSNGGSNFFGVDDIDSGRRPFTIEAGARSNALYVDDGGRIGFGTSTPVVRMHAREGNTPTLRLEQDGSSGFTAYTWDLAGNETNFFIRDVNNGSALPFRVFPGNNTDVLNIRNSRVGINDNNPADSDGRLHVRSTGTDIAMTIDASGMTGDATPAMRIVTGQTPGLIIDGSAISNFENALQVDGSARLGGLINDGFVRINSDGLPFPLRVVDNANSLVQLLLDSSGNLTVSGSITPSSDVNVKENITPVDTDAVLAGVLALPIHTWEYIADQNDALHLGPMAQDFAAAFGLGLNETTIATVDADGVALASIQALAARNETAAARIAELEAANATLEARLARLEALLGANDHE